MDFLKTEERGRDFVPFSYKFLDPYFGVTLDYNVRINYMSAAEALSQGSPHYNTTSSLAQGAPFVCRAFFEAGPMPLPVSKLAMAVNEIDLLPSWVPYLTEARGIKKWAPADRLFMTRAQLPIPLLKRVFEMVHQRFGFDLLLLDEMNSCEEHRISASNGFPRKKEEDDSGASTRTSKLSTSRDATPSSSCEKTPLLQPGFVLLEYGPKAPSDSAKDSAFGYRDAEVPGVTKEDWKKMGLMRTEIGTLCIVATPVKIEDPKKKGSFLEGVTMKGGIELEVPGMARKMMPNSLVRLIARTMCRQMTTLLCKLGKEWEKVDENGNKISEHAKREENDEELKWLGKIMDERAETFVQSRFS